MRTHSRRLWVPFGIVAVLSIFGLFVLDGAASGVVLLVALVSFVGACIYALAGERVEDGAGGIGGPLGLG
jgi:hypothetical protein